MSSNYLHVKINEMASIPAIIPRINVYVGTTMVCSMFTSDWVTLFVVLSPKGKSNSCLKNEQRLTRWCRYKELVQRKMQI